MRLFQEIAGLGAQPLQDSRLGLEDGVLDQARFRRHAGRRVAIQRESPERFPGRRMEIDLDDRQQSIEDVTVVVPVALAVRGFQPIEEADGRYPSPSPIVDRTSAPGSSAVPRISRSISIRAGIIHLASPHCIPVITSKSVASVESRTLPSRGHPKGGRRRRPQRTSIASANYTNLSKNHYFIIRADLHHPSLRAVEGSRVRHIPDTDNRCGFWSLPHRARMLRAADVRNTSKVSRARNSPCFHCEKSP